MLEKALLIPMLDNEGNVVVMDPELSEMTLKAPEWINYRLAHFGNLYHDTLFYYGLTHTYDENTPPRYVKGHISPLKFNLLIAYLQLAFFDVIEDTDLSSEDLVTLLTKYYGLDNLSTRDEIFLNRHIVQPFEVDQYVNWEAFAAPYAEHIQHLGVLSRPELRDDLNAIKDRLL